MSTLLTDTTFPHAPNITNRDISKIESLLTLASLHECNGRYKMVAAWVKGKRSIVGQNNSDRPAATITNGYPDICGVHAELDLWMRCQALNLDMRGGTVYIVGRKSSNDNIMSTTKPCIYCRAILSSTKVRSVIYFDSGKIHKMEASRFW